MPNALSASHGIDDLASTFLLLSGRSLAFVLGLHPVLLNLGALLIAIGSLSRRRFRPSLLAFGALRRSCLFPGLSLLLSPGLAILTDFVAALFTLCFALLACLTDLLLLLSVPGHGLSASELLSSSAYFGHVLPP